MLEKFQKVGSYWQTSNPLTTVRKDLGAQKALHVYGIDFAFLVTVMLFIA